MADIDIQKKKKTPVWPWIIGILALVVVAFLLYWLLSEPGEEEAVGIIDTDTTEQVQTEAVGIAQTGAVYEYITWTENFNNAEMGIHHEFTKNGLKNMANALAAVAERAENVNRTEFENKLNRMRAMADSITDNWENTQHANKIKRAAEASVDVMRELQQTSFSGLGSEIDNVEQDVSQLDPQVLTLEQKEGVKSFFRESANVLRKMDERVSG